MKLIHIIDIDNRKHLVNPNHIIALVDKFYTEVQLSEGRTILVNLTLEATRDMIESRIKGLHEQMANNT